MEFKDRLKFLRERKSLTQQNMANILDIAKSTYVKYERGEREPRYGTLVALSQYFDVTIDYLLCNTEEDNKHIDRINEIYNFISTKEYANSQGKNLKSVQKLISEFMQIVYLSDQEPMLDILYVLNSLENKLIQLYESGLHIYMYDIWSKEDETFKEVVLKPNKLDYINHIKLLADIRQILDSYLETMSSEEYFIKNILKYKKEIEEYSNINVKELQHKFKTDPRYKML